MSVSTTRFMIQDELRIQVKGLTMEPGDLLALGFRVYLHGEYSKCNQYTGILYHLFQRHIWLGFG